jgi:predicted ribosome quality control (RQC) complex YloA/Tae2 family protein
LRRRMISNYYTLFHLAAELHRECTGKTIKEVFTQHRGELVVSFVEIPAVVIINCEPSGNSVYLRSDFARARRNSLDLLKETFGLRIDQISLHPTDREIVFLLADRRSMKAQLFGSRANVFLTNDKGVIIDSFLNKSIDTGRSSAKRTDGIDPRSPEIFAQAVSTGDAVSIDIRSRLKTVLPRFGSVLIAELLLRSGIEGTREAPTLSDTEITRLARVSSEMISELTGAPSPRIYFDGSTPLRFSIISLRSFEQYRYQLYDTISEGIRTYIGTRQKTLSFQREYDAIQKAVNKELERIQTTLGKIDSENITPEFADELELKAELLMAHLPEVHKGMQDALLENVLQRQGPPVAVALDPHLTPAKNAERYFEKAKRARRTMGEQREQKQSLLNKRARLQAVASELESIESSSDLEDFKNAHREILDHIGIKAPQSTRTAREHLPPFRIFAVTGGFQVWAGKSGENNDLLTTRYTAKNDLWFHARGAGGSHVVLKVGTGKGEISKRAIEETAAIAAYYSKMKNSKLVPVSMCEGKFVRKPKGAPAGTVTIDREKTIFVEPRLPV